jgi:hypothetical protein
MHLQLIENRVEFQSTNLHQIKDSIISSCTDIITISRTFRNDEFKDELRRCCKIVACWGQDMSRNPSIPSGDDFNSITFVFKFNLMKKVLRQCKGLKDQ